MSAEAIRRLFEEAEESIYYMHPTKGLMATITNGKGEDEITEDIRISGVFEILGRVRDPNGEGWARLLRWRDADNVWHSYAVADASLHGDPKTVCSELASRGLEITTSKHRPHLNSLSQSS